ncbi:hypothetical protein H072_9093 [Dactylellina haptotyla CBS 200.50]|uniref:Uncharacterized protein n=1 Tax=Dactylellina haptotyla (strain CBS 200.50) TaxID=1284197 RepID=S8BPV5_DACHA|nr:hypothetical protein H072_9093 [Dactylellina haptotyla CBS 200.50]
MSKDYRKMIDFIQERKYHIPAYIRILEIRDNIHTRHARGSKKVVDAFTDILFAFLSKCVGVRKVLRDGYEHKYLKTPDLVRKLLELPKLKILCLKIHQDGLWYYNETPKFNEYESVGTDWNSDHPRGLACLSLALPMSLDRPWWNEVWVLCRQILLSNTETLKHLYFDGPDLEIIVAKMADLSLAKIRPESLRFRMGFNPQKFQTVIGLSALIPGENASTNLRRLEFHDLEGGRQFNPNMLESANMITFMRTNNLKRFQIFGPSRQPQILQPHPTQLSQPGIDHLQTFKGLEVAEFQISTNRWWLEQQIRLLAEHHKETLHTICMQSESFSLSQTVFSEFPQTLGFSALNRIEIHHDGTCLLASIKSIWDIISVQPTITEFQICMSPPLQTTRRRLILPTSLFGRSFSLPRRILTPIYSTAFYLSNHRSGVDSSSFTCGNIELYNSTRICTPYRAMLAGSGCDKLHINTYLRNMFYTNRLENETQQYPEPRHDISLNVVNDVEPFYSFFTGIPKNLRLFQLQYVQKSGADECEMIRRQTDNWRKRKMGEWLYEPELTPLMLG